MNKVVLLGRLARDPEVRYTQSAEPLAVCNFAVAVDRPFSRNRQEGEPTADFINCVCFGKRGENINQYFRKGNRIAVTGRIQTRNYTDQQGNKRYATEVVVDDFEFVESKSERAASTDSSASYTQYSAPAQDSSNNSAPDGFFFAEDSADDNDLPF
jgi:single-strand DNA-binding protein